MPLDHPFEEPTAIRTNLGAIFVSLELSRSTWLITSLSPGGGEKMSKHSVSAGDIAALLSRSSELKQKAFARMGQSFPIIAFKRRDWMASGGRGGSQLDPTGLANATRDPGRSSRS
jgi:transposase